MIRRVAPEFTVLSDRMLPAVSSLRMTPAGMSITGVPEALALTVKKSCLVASWVVSVEVRVYADTAAAIEVATSEAVTPPVLEMLRFPSISVREIASCTYLA